MTNDQRISKILSNRGVCSRREADHFISKGWVSLDGQVVEVGQKASENADIELSEEALKSLKKQYTFLLNKPVGYVSNLPEKGYKEALELLTCERMDTKLNPPDENVNPQKLKGLAAAGRLDIDSQGLIVFTQNGRIAKQLIGENSDVEKEYLVRVEGTLSKEGLSLLNHGLSLDDKKLKPAQVEWLNKDQLRFILKEGKKRQIRRMCELVGLKVTGLKRVRIGAIRLGKLKEGHWRVFGPQERF